MMYYVQLITDGAIECHYDLKTYDEAKKRFGSLARSQTLSESYAELYYHGVIRWKYALKRTHDGSRWIVHDDPVTGEPIGYAGREYPEICREDTDRDGRPQVGDVRLPAIVVPREIADGLARISVDMGHSVPEIRRMALGDIIAKWEDYGV